MRRTPEGIVRVTRHPFLIGVGLWAVVHLVANGDVASFIFFGAFAVTALADPRSSPALGVEVLALPKSVESGNLSFSNRHPVDVG
jgi:protein-S-isoprenylcysteine O-methyltransferase Ste14